MAQWWERSPLTSVAQVRFRSSVMYGLSVLLALTLFPGFFSGFSGFPPSKKASVSKFQLHQDKARARKPSKSDVVSSLNIAIFYLVIIYLRFKVPVFITLLTLLSTFSKVMYRMGSYETPALLQTPNVFTLSTSRATTVT